MRYEKSNALKFLHSAHLSKVVQFKDAIKALDIHTQQIIGIILESKDCKDIVKNIKKL